MPSSQRDPKSLAEWMELDYLDRPRRLQRMRRWLTWGTVFSCLGALAFVSASGKHEVYQAAPVSTAHAMFNHNCSVCHTQAFQAIERLWSGDANTRSVADHVCQSCHNGPRHHETQVRDTSCAVCHREHRGQMVLAHVPDAQCTGCHADLQTGVKKGLEPRFHNVKGFAPGDHPEFALWANKDSKDPGTIHFNHQVHLVPEGVLAIDEKQLGQTRDNMKKGARNLKRIKLECSSCHQLDEAGRYMMPIRYDKHCSDCHPLSVRLGGDFQGPAQKAAQNFNRTPIPHRRPETVRAALREWLTRFVLKHVPEAEIRTEETIERPIPGKRPPQAMTEKKWTWVDRQLEQMERPLFTGAGGCRYCHQVKVGWDKDRLPEYAFSRINEREFAGVGLTNRWLPHSRFDHNRHRMLSCTECHGRAPGSRLTSDILIPRIESCQKCHNPQVGVRSDCAECHRYHNLAEKQKFKGGLTVEECLGSGPFTGMKSPAR